ncbi:MAG: M48 family metalloprotease [Armatimonadetes bacterium]|nr:M48 family metalloprotease [Armatimonadota bacterium]
MKKISLFLILFFIISFLPVFSISLEEEIQIGKNASLELEKKYKVLTDKKYQERINWIGSLLYRVAPRKELPYTFKVIESDVYNALSFPGGFIYATSKLMDVSSDGEAAFVLGHEMAHAAHSHQIKQAEKEMGTNLGLIILALILNKGSINRGTSNIIGLTNTIINSSYSRADEKQADLDSLSYMLGAGIDPRYALLSFEKMKKHGEALPGFLNTLVGSHPLPEERIEYTKSAISKMNFKPVNPPIPPLNLNENNKDTGTPQKKLQKELTAKINSEKKEKNIIKITPEKDFISYRQIPWENVNQEYLKKGNFMPEAEEYFYNFLKQAFPKIERNKFLDSKTRFLSLKLTEKTITSEYVIYADLVNYNLDYFGDLSTFKENFSIYDLPKIKALNKEYSQAGIAIKNLIDGRKYIIIALKYF